MVEETTQLVALQSFKKRFSETSREFRLGYYAIAFLQIVSICFILTGQTVSLVAYKWTTTLGLQESETSVGPTMVRVNKSIAAADSILYLPLLMTSAYGLFRKQRWSLICTTASASLHSYWALVALFGYVFLPSVPEFTYRPDGETQALVICYFVYGLAVLTFDYVHWDLLLEVMSS